MDSDGDRKIRRYRARKCIRQQLWTSMRIMFPKPFTVPGLLRTVEGVTYANVQSYVSRLYQAGYLVKVGTVKRGHCGEYQKYRLEKEHGPIMPVLGIGRHKKKEKEKQREEETHPHPIPLPEGEGMQCAVPAKNCSFGGEA